MTILPANLFDKLTNFNCGFLFLFLLRRGHFSKKNNVSSPFKLSFFSPKLSSIVKYIKRHITFFSGISYTSFLNQSLSLYVQKSNEFFILLSLKLYISLYWFSLQWPNLKNLSGGLNLSCGLIMVGST